MYCLEEEKRKRQNIFNFKIKWKKQTDRIFSTLKLRGKRKE